MSKAEKTRGTTSSRQRRGFIVDLANYVSHYREQVYSQFWQKTTGFDYPMGLIPGDQVETEQQQTSTSKVFSR
jgi:hypothetical protein